MQKWLSNLMNAEELQDIREEINYCELQNQLVNVKSKELKKLFPRSYKSQGAVNTYFEKNFERVSST